MNIKTTLCACGKDYEAEGRGACSKCCGIINYLCKDDRLMKKINVKEIKTKCNCGEDSCNIDFTENYLKQIAEKVNEIIDFLSTNTQ